MILSKSELKFYISEDAKANGITFGPSYYFKLIYGNTHAIAFRYLKSLRKYEYYNNIHSILRFLYRFYNRRLGVKYNLAFPINAIGYGLYIPHIEGGILLNCKSIGNYCDINSGVVVGRGHNNEEIPIIGNHVSLTVGCKVIGNIRIGDYSVVAPNSVVIKDVPNNSVVSGVPARIIKKDGKKVE